MYHILHTFRSVLIVGYLSILPTIAVTQPFDPYKVPIDSLQSWLRTRLQSVSDDSTSLALCHIGLKRALQEEDNDALALAYFQLAEWHNYHFYYFEHDDSAVYYDQMAIEAYETLGDAPTVAELYFYLGIDNEGLGRLNEAEAAILEASRRYRALEDNIGLGYTYVALGLIYSSLGDTTQAVEYGIEGIEILEEAEYDRIPLEYSRVAEIFSYTSDLDQIEYYATKAIDGFENGYRGFQDVTEYYQSYTSRARANIRRGNYELALLDLEFALETSSKHLTDTLAEDLLWNLGLVYNLQERYDLAVPPLEQAYAFMSKYDIETTDLHDELVTAYVGTGQLDKALFHQKRASEIQADLWEERFASIESELLAKYEADRKDATIASQQETLAQQRRVQWLVGGVAILLLIVALLSFYNYRSKQRSNEQLKKLNNTLSEKNAQNELLLREIHHRVKNNLETVSSLLELQSAQLGDSQARDAMIASQTRVQSMGIIHQKLYRGSGVTNVEMKDYFEQLGTNMLEAYQMQDRVDVEVEMNKVELDIDTAIPVGLIVTELLTNALKYAFTGMTDGIVQIKLYDTSSDHLQLIVSDNGVGKVVGEMKGTGFGSQLVSLLTIQLQGTLREEQSNGTSFLIDFPYEKPAYALR